MRLSASLALAMLVSLPVTTQREPASGPFVQPQVPTSTSQDVPLDYVFSGGAGLLFFHIRADQATAFEAVAARVTQVLAASDDPTRRQQASSWSVFRSLEDHPNPIYVFVFDPVVADADYDLVKILTEAVPAEVQDLYAQLQAAIVRIERMGLARVS